MSVCPCRLMLPTSSYSHVCLSPANRCFTCPPILTSDCLRPISASHILLFSHYFVSSQSVLHVSSYYHVSLLFSRLFVSGQSMLYSSYYSNNCLYPANQCALRPSIHVYICVWRFSAPHIVLFSRLFVFSQSMLHMSSYFRILLSSANQ